MEGGGREGGRGTGIRVEVVEETEVFFQVPDLWKAGFEALSR